MVVQAEISLYPLKTQSLSVPIEEFCKLLGSRGLEVETGPMSTRVVGEAGALFGALEEAFVQSANAGPVVLSLKVSNTCPKGFGG